MITGGRDQSGALRSTDIYNPLTGTFSARPTLTTPRSGHTATVLADGNILFAGGDIFGTAELYNPNLQIFSLVTGQLSTPRHFHSAVLTNAGQVLIVGGMDAQNRTLKTAEIFDPVTQAFYLPPADMRASRALSIIKMLSDGKIQIIGGDSDFSMEVFDPATGIFNANALLPPMRNAELYVEYTEPSRPVFDAVFWMLCCKAQ